MTPSITVERVGRRSYLRGNTYPIKDQIRSAGGHWDADQRAWWIGSDDTARKLAEQHAASAASTSAPESSRSAPGLAAIVAGKAAYKGRTYYVAGRVDRGRTHYDDRVSAVVSRDGSRVLLYSRDGQMQFWAQLHDPLRGMGSRITIADMARPAAHDQAAIVKHYDRPQTIGSLQRFAEQARANGGTHPNACPNCGSTSCSTAYGRGGLCDED